MYEHVKVSEPMRAGCWRRYTPHHHSTIEEVSGPVNGKMWWYDWTGALCECREQGVTWTGPIDVPGEEPAPNKGLSAEEVAALLREQAELWRKPPSGADELAPIPCKTVYDVLTHLAEEIAPRYEAKPTPREGESIRVHCPAAHEEMCRIAERTQLAADKPTPSEDEKTMCGKLLKTIPVVLDLHPSEDTYISEETNRMNKKALEAAREKDEGEELGRRLFAIRTGLTTIRQWRALEEPNREGYRQAAPLFYAKCVAPWKELEKAAREMEESADSNDRGYRGIEPGIWEQFSSALSALPDLGEFAEAKPRVSDEPPRPNDHGKPAGADIAAARPITKPRVSDEALGKAARDCFLSLVCGGATSFIQLGAAIRAKLEE